MDRCGGRRKWPRAEDAVAMPMDANSAAEGSMGWASCGCSGSFIAMRELRPASLALTLLCSTFIPLGFAACEDDSSNVPAGSGSHASGIVDIDMSPNLVERVSRPLWPFAVKWQLPKNLIMDKQDARLDYTQTYQVGTHDLGYFSYTERVITASSSAGTEIGNPVGAEIAILMGEHGGGELFPLKKLPERVSGQGLLYNAADWTFLSHVYYIQLANPTPTSNPDEDKVAGYLLTFDFGGPPDHPWGSKGLFTRAVLTSLVFGAL